MRQAKKFLLLIVFIGDGQIPFTQAAVISIDAELSPSRVRDEIEDGFSSYIDATDWEKQPFYDSVDAVLSASGYQYEIVHDNIPAVDTYRTLYI